MTVAFSPSEELYFCPFQHENRRKDSQRTLVNGNISENISGPLTVPGYPLIAFEDDRKVQALIKTNLCTKKVDKLYRYLWLVSTKAGSQIFPLHFQKVKGREIVITEDHQLHLVWHYDRYFVKPIPEFLLNHLFWKHHLSDRSSEEYKTALGFLRSWSYLIRTQSDFDVAIEKKLLRWNVDHEDKIQNYIAFKKLMTFLSHFSGLHDKSVSRRYRYGELCLSRLNLWSRITWTSRSYHRVYGQYGALLSYIITPLLFAFAVFSVVLTALQVELAAEQVGTAQPWQSYGTAARWFSFTTLGVAVVSVLIVFSSAGYLAVDELIWAIRYRGGTKDKVVYREAEV